MAVSKSALKIRDFPRVKKCCELVSRTCICATPSNIGNYFMEDNGRGDLDMDTEYIKSCKVLHKAN